MFYTPTLEILTGLGLVALSDGLGVRVDVTIQGQGWPLTPQMLGLEYHNWIQDCNKKYDTDECREDQSKRLRQICATEFHNKLETGITHAGKYELKSSRL